MAAGLRFFPGTITAGIVFRIVVRQQQGESGRIYERLCGIANMFNMARGILKDIENSTWSFIGIIVT